MFRTFCTSWAYNCVEISTCDIRKSNIGCDYNISTAFDRTDTFDTR
jgi:hypothetical protein